MKTFIACAFAITLLAGPVRADENTSGSANDSAKTDQHVLSKIHHGNHMEIEMSKLVDGRTETNGTKEFAKDIIQAHGTADIEVKMTAKKESLKLQDPLVPANDDERQAMNDDHAEMTKLKSLKGAAFDAEYQSAMIASHKKTIDELTAVLPSLGKPTHTLVEKLLPEFQKHLDMANKMTSPTT